MEQETALIRVERLPVIVERLQEVKEEVLRTVDEAKAMVCTEETIQAVKKKRAELRKELESLEAQRKAVKKAVLSPYERFEEIYKECITVPFSDADAALKEKIIDIEDAQKSRAEKECRRYFEELVKVHNVDWLKFEQAGLKVSLTEAKKQTPSKCFDFLSEFVARVACDVDAIEGMGEDAPLVFAEYRKNGLKLAMAQKTISERRDAEAAEEKRLEQRREAEQRAVVAAQKVDEAAKTTEMSVLAPPTVETVQAEESERKFPKKITFTIFPASEEEFQKIRPELLNLRGILKKEGIRYE